MKPTKNRYYCEDCGRIKMLFETEKKADNFIKFNADEIEENMGFKPERSYYCISCGGWHVTSKTDWMSGTTPTENVLDLYEYVKHREMVAQMDDFLDRAEEELAKLEKKLSSEKYYGI